MSGPTKAQMVSEHEKQIQEIRQGQERIALELQALSEQVRMISRVLLFDHGREAPETDMEPSDGGRRRVKRSTWRCRFLGHKRTMATWASQDGICERCEGKC